MFRIVTQAFDRNLLTVEELRAAVGLAASDSSQDDKLAALGLRVASMITKACRVVEDGINPPTLMLEGCVETFRLNDCSPYLYLSRRPIVQVTSLVEVGATLAEDVDFEVEAAAGRLLRLSGSAGSNWRSGKIEVEYDAGYEEVPDDLKAIAAQLAGGYWVDEGVDPMEKRLSVPGVFETERWVDTGANGQMPAEIYDALIAGGYVNRSMVL